MGDRGPLTNRERLRPAAASGRTRRVASTSQTGGQYSSQMVERISPLHNRSPSLPRKHPESSPGGAGDGAEFRKVVGVTGNAGFNSVTGSLPSGVPRDTNNKKDRQLSGMSHASRISAKVESASLDLPQWRAISETLAPLMFLYCLYGVLPFAFRPLRISLNPFRSTLLYSVAAFGVISWSVWITANARIEMLLSANECMDLRIMAMQALAHVTAHIFVPITWLEVRILRKRPRQWDKFAAEFGHLVGRRLPKKTRYMSHFLAFIVLVAVPVGVAAWVVALPQVGTRPTHALAHTHVTAVCLLMCFFFFIECRSLSDLANDICNLLNQMVSEKRITAELLAEYRRAWLSLHDLLASAGGLSVGVLLFLLYLLVLITLSMYQFLVALSSGHWFLGVGLCALSSLYLFQLFIMCDSAHRATATMQLSFASALSSLQMHMLDYDLRCEVHHFLSTLAVTPAGVWVAGFVVVNRQLMGSMMAAVVTYLVVLLQFRQSDERGECDALNATLANLF